MENVSSNSTTPEINNIPESGRILLITLGVIITLIGIPGNILTALPIVMCKSLRTRLNIFIVNLCVADFITIGYLYPFNVFDLIFRRNPISLLWCQVNYLVIDLIAPSTFITILLITISRYVKIMHESKFDTIFSGRNTIAYCVLSWIPGSVLLVGTALDLSQIKYFPDASMCLTKVENATLTIAIVVPVYGIAYISSLVCYLRIWRRLSENEAKLRHHGDDHATKAKHYNNRKQASMSFLIVLMYICLTMPSLIVYSATLPVSRFVYATVLLIYHGNSSLNCIVYGAMHKSIVRYYRELLSTCRSNRVQP